LDWSRTGVPELPKSLPVHPLRNHYTTLPTLYFSDCTTKHKPLWWTLPSVPGVKRRIWREEVLCKLWECTLSERLSALLAAREDVLRVLVYATEEDWVLGKTLTNQQSILKRSRWNLSYIEGVKKRRSTSSKCAAFIATLVEKGG
jgi:hypothetical protein